MVSIATEHAKRERLHRRLTAVILVVGFSSALLVYVFARPPAAGHPGYEPLETKSYVRDLEVYGGKWNVFQEEFRNWFSGLWRGKRLAFPIAVITLLLPTAIRIFSTPLPQEPSAETEQVANRGPGHPGSEHGRISSLSTGASGPRRL